ncbi:genetic suppressor element 1-like isoform X2 [Scyliorhinus torazame]|uniref:genetic suppressor element 1-like isoform X2 n=1 Tax=Scyliorhinus torazame TaxID=75743 RepID=UPI003B5A6196
MFGLKPSMYFFPGMSHEPKSSSLSMISATQRTTATVNPLTPSSLNGPVVTNGNPSSLGASNARGVHTASFAAALRKLAKQAEDPRGSSHGSERSPISSPAANHSSPAGTPKRPPGTIIVPPGSQTAANTPPVVTIAPTQTVNGLWRGDSRQPSDSTLRSRSRDHPLSTESLLKKDKTAVHTHLASSHPAFYLSSHSIQESPYSTINLQRPVPHLVSSSSRSDDFLAGFRPYHGRDEVRSLSSLPSLGLDSPTAAAPAAYYHPTFLTHLPYQHPTYRIDDPYVLSLQSPFLHIPQPGTLPPLQPTSMHLSLTAMRQPLGLAHPSLAGVHPDHLSVLTAGRLQMDNEVRQREKEHEHKEKDWERGTPQEREPEVTTEQDRKREKQQEMEWEKEVKRRKEMKQEKELEIEYGVEKNAIPINNTGKRRLEGWRNFFSAMEQFQPVQSNDEHANPWRIIPSTQPEKSKPSSLGNGKARTLPLEPIALPASSSLLGVPANLSSYSSSLEGKCALRHSHQQQVREEQPGHGVDLHLHHLHQLHKEQGHQFSEQERDRSRAMPEDENQDRPLRLRAPPPLISPQRPLRETSPLSRPFLSPHALQPAQALNYSTNYSRINHDALKNPERLQNNSLKKYAFNKITGEHFNKELTKSCTEKDVSVIKSGIPTLKADNIPHLKDQISSHQSTKDFDSDFKHQTANSRLEEMQKECLDLSTTSGATDLSLKSRTNSRVSNASMLSRNHATANSVYNQELLLQQPIVSKLDLAEKKLKEARKNGQHSEHSSSDGGFCKGEIRNRIRRVAEQPPLKLDDTPRKMLFLGAVGLTTQSRKEEVKWQKMRKRRRMLRERSPPPLYLEKKRHPPLPPPRVCSIIHSPEELNRAADFEEKKQFLALFNLKHLTAAQRKDIEETLLKLLSKSEKKCTSQQDPQASHSAQSNKDPTLCSDAPGVTGVAEVSRLSTIPPDSNPNAHSQEDLPAQLQAERGRPLLTPDAPETVSKDHTSSVNENKSDKLGAADPSSGSSDEAKQSGMISDTNGKIKLLDDFLLKFHKALLQSTKNKLEPDQPKVGGWQSDMLYSSPAQSSALCDVPKQQVLDRLDQSRQVNPQAEELDSQDEMDQRSKWQGVTGVLEAYQEYIEEKNVERQVLQEQLNHLKERNHELNLTAEHLNAHMLELRMCKQRYEMERQHQQAALRHLRKCLDLTHRLPASSYR